MENLNIIEERKEKTSETLDVLEQYIRALDKKYEMKKEPELKKCIKSMD
jgi:hypothetical protein